ncbi:hypothetical protein OKW45_008053 [Paraburkholderia sp. WSM4175]|uniref:hypothetical protein n=1 Tax=Paraburkholderia sp. WSM4175 TaxID=2991072 RepID=UPI003D2119B4
MHHPADLAEHRAESGPGDRSICLEAHGFLNQSYDSLDSLLRDITHSNREQSVDHAGAADLTLIGLPEGLISLGHLFL